MTLDDLTRHLATLATGQHGLVRTNQVPAGELNRFRHLTRRGVFERVARGVYRFAGAPTTWPQRLRAGIWILGPDAAISHRSAARLHRFDRFGDVDLAEFVVPRSRRNGSTAGVDGIVHSSVIEFAADRVNIGGLPVTSAARTIIDLARIGEPRTRLEAAIDSAIRHRLATLDQITDLLARFAGPARWGVARLAPLLADSGGHSFLERRFLRLVRRAGLPRPTPQVVHRRNGRHLARVDFLFPVHGVVVEVSGGRGHSSAADRAKDARRRNELQQIGRTVLEFTFDDVTRRESDVVATLERSLLHRVTVSRSAASEP